MTTTCRLVLVVAVIVCASDARGQSARREPHIGYIYPGGGRRGSTFEVNIGGQHLRSPTAVYVSGEGVRASIIKYYRPVRVVNGEQRVALVKRLAELSEKRWAELVEKGKVKGRPPWRGAVKKRPGKRGAKPGKTGRKSGKPVKKAGKPGKGSAKPGATSAKPVELPDHPLLRDLEKKSLRELQYIRREIFEFRKRQRNPQLGETVLIEVTMDRDATPGDRELRVETRTGLTNPMVFQVGVLPEVAELERNDPRDFDPLPKEPAVRLPVVMNGQIMPGDVDRFRFRAKQGQQLLIETSARRLVPFLADAVPGWFQATLAVYDARGNEITFADDFRFDPDPVLFWKVPKDGEYELEIRDAIYRGRQDFVYRVVVGEQPFVTRMFPLGGRAGSKTYAAVDGWNLNRKKRRLDTDPGGDGIRQATFGYSRLVTNAVTYAVDTLRDCREAESNDGVKNAQRIVLPRIVNGCIERPGDVDTFRFDGKAGDEVVAEVVARRLHSPLDSLLRLTDAAGRVLAWNDDHECKDGYLHMDMGLLTHHADSYLRARLPQDGVYYMHLADSQNHGGAAYAYRLRISPPRPDFALRATPSSLSVRPGRSVAMRVYAMRKDGFDGDVDVVLDGAPAGFSLAGARIPAGRDSIRMTLTAPPKPLGEPVALELKGRAKVGDGMIVRRVMPAEDVMQAFLYRHLAPSQELMVAVMKGSRPGPTVEWVRKGVVQVPAGGVTQVQLKTPPIRRMPKIELDLSDPPPGMTLQKVTPVRGGLALQFKADGKAAKVGLADNLIVEAFTKVMRPARGGKKKKVPQRVSLGVLPAIPFKIVQR